MTSEAPVLVSILCPTCSGEVVIHARVAEREPTLGLELDTLADTDPAPAPEHEED